MLETQTGEVTTAVSEQTRPSLQARALSRAIAIAKPLVLLAIFIGIWQLAVDDQWLPKFELAAPTTVASYIVGHLSLLFTSTKATLVEILVAFAIALGGAMVLAILINQFKILEDSLLPLLVTSLQAAPGHLIEQVHRGREPVQRLGGVPPHRRGLPPVSRGQGPVQGRRGDDFRGRPAGLDGLCRRGVR